MRLPPHTTTSLDPFALSVDVRRDLPEERTVPAIGASGWIRGVKAAALAGLSGDANQVGRCRR
jgi:hypothetical protein